MKSLSVVADQILYQSTSFLMIILMTRYLSADGFKNFITIYSIAFTVFAPLSIINTGIYYFKCTPDVRFMASIYNLLPLFPISIMAIIACEFFAQGEITHKSLIALAMVVCMVIYDVHRKTLNSKNELDLGFHILLIIIIIISSFASSFLGSGMILLLAFNIAIICRVLSYGHMFNLGNKLSFDYLNMNWPQAVGILIFALYTQYGFLIVANQMDQNSFVIFRSAYNLSIIGVIIGVGVENLLMRKAFDSDNKLIIPNLLKYANSLAYFYVILGVMIAGVVGVFFSTIYDQNFTTSVLIFSILAASGVVQNISRISVIYLKQSGGIYVALLGEIIAFFLFFYLIRFTNGDLIDNCIALALSISVSCLPVLVFSYVALGKTRKKNVAVSNN